MAKIVKTLTVSWQWSGDKYSLRGFNLAVTPAAKNPKEEVVATAFVETKEIKQTYSYKMGNVTLDKDAQYKIWVQAVYENSDSDWVATGGATVSDDGSATIITKTDREIQDVVNMASDNILTRQEKISLRREWQEIVYEFLEIESTAISQGIPSSNTAFSNFKSKGNALGTYLNGGTAWTISSNNKTSFPLWINDSNLGSNTSINGNTYRETFRVYYEAKVKILEEINKYKVNSVQVGGVNLLVGTATAKNTNVNVPTSYVTWDPYTTHNKQTLEQLGFKVGDKITVGFDWSISKNGTNDYVYGNFRVEFKGIKSDGTDNQYLGTIKNPAGTFSSSNTKGRVEATVSLDSTTIKAHSIRFRIDNSVLNFKVSNLKMERGTKATGWSPALEEMENAYTVILTNEAQVIPTNSNRVPTSSTTYFTDIQVYKGTAQRNDYTIGAINNANGITVSKTSSRVNFAVSTNTALAADGGNFIIPITIDGKTFNKTFSWSCSKQGNTGATGASGIGISKITEYYAVSSSNTTEPTSWSTTVPTMTATNKYLWNYETITYSNNTTANTSKRVIGVYGDKGNTGATGATGNGISKIVNYYLATSSSSGVTTSTSGWTTSVQAVSASKKYLWNYEVITYTNGSTSTTTPCIIGAYGDTGATGATGPAGQNAQHIVVTGEQVFKYTNNFSGTPAPSTITLTATKINTTATGKWQWLNGSTWTDWTSGGSTVTATTLSVSPTSGSLNTGKSIRIRYIVGSVYDEITIVKVSDGTNGTNGTNGTDAHTVILTNETHTFPTQNNGNIPTALSTTTQVVAYKGASSITPTIGNLPSVSGLTLSKSGTTVTVQANTGTSLADSGSFNIPVTVDGKSFTKTFSWSKAKQGNTGATGAAGQNASHIVVTGEQVFKYTNNFSGTPTPANITLTATKINTTATGKWQWLNGSTWEDWSSNTNTLNATTLSVSPTSGSLNTGKSIRIRYIVGSVYDEITLVKVSDGAKGANGTNGADAYTVILTNETHSFPTQNNGNIPTALSTTTQVMAYKGATSVSPTIGTLPTVAGLTLSKSNSTVTIQANTGTSLADSGSFNIPVMVDGKTFNKTFSWSKAKQGNTGATGNAGKDAITIVLSNENHTFPCESNGNIPAVLSTTCAVTAYKGSASVTPTIGSITNPTGMTISKNGATLTIQANTGTSLADSGTVNIPITVDGKTFNKIFTWSKAKKGATGATGPQGAQGNKGDKGDTGQSAKYVIVNGEQVFKYTNNFSGTPTPATITLTATKFNTSESGKWQYKDSSGTWIDWLSGGSVVTATTVQVHPTSGILGNAKQMSIRYIVGSVYDEITIVKVSDGSQGPQGIQGTQGATGQNADSVGVISKNYDVVAGNGHSELYIRGKKVANSSVTGHTVFKINKTTLAVEQTTKYATYGNESACTEMANYLNGLSNCIVAIISSDACRVTDALRTAISKIGGSKTGTWGGSRYSHYVIGMPGLASGQGYEEYKTGASATLSCTVPVSLGVGILTNGAQGIQGNKGDKGDTGATGPQGSAGKDAYTVILTNESHTFPAENNGSIASNITVTTDVLSYKGASSITPTIGTLPTVNGLTLSKTNNRVTIVAKSGTALADSGSFNIPITVDGKSFTKTFSWAKSRKGNTGATGATGAGAKTADIIASSQVFKSADGGLTFSPTTITMTPKLQNVTYSNWQYSTNGGSNWNGFSNSISGWSISSGVLTINKDCSLFTPAVTSVVFRLNTNDSSVYDTTTVVKLYDVVDLEIGGRNLARKGSIVKYNTNASATTVNDANFLTDGSATISRTAVVNEGAMIDRYVVYDGGAKYVVAFKMRTTSGTVNSIHFYNGRGHKNTKVYIDGAYKGTMGQDLTFPNDTNYHKVEVRFEAVATDSATANAQNTNHIIPQPMKGTASAYTIQILNLKIEKGNKATDWTPSPEDIKTQAEQSAQNAVNAQTQTSIFNKLTNNGQTQGIFLDGGKIWINGEYVKANSITADRLSISDFTNYAQLNNDTAAKYGFTKQADEVGGAWLKRNSMARDIFISGYYTCNGGESFRIKYDISTTIKGNSSSGGTDSVYRGTAIGLYCYDGSGKSVGIVYSTRYTNQTVSGSSSTVKIPTTARKFRVFIQTESYGNWSGELKVRNIQVIKMAGGELIVDGAITADRITSGTFRGTNFIAGGSSSNGYVEVLDSSNKLIFKAQKGGVVSRKITFVNDVNSGFGSSTPIVTSIDQEGINMGYRTGTSSDGFNTSESKETKYASSEVRMRYAYRSENASTGSTSYMREEGMTLTPKTINFEVLADDGSGSITTGLFKKSAMARGTANTYQAGISVGYWDSLMIGSSLGSMESGGLGRGAGAEVFMEIDSSRLTLHNGVQLSNSSDGNRLKIQGRYGNVTIGSYNDGWCHFNTDRPKFYFDKGMAVNGEIHAGSGYNQRVYHQGWSPKSGNYWSGGAAFVNTDGVMEIGKYIDFHNSNSTTADYDNRITSNGNTLEFSGNIKAAGSIYVRESRVATQAGHGGLDIGGTDRNTAICSANAPTWWNGSSSFVIYTSGSKPTPADIGALGNSGSQTLHVAQGKFTITGNGSLGHIDVAGGFHTRGDSNDIWFERNVRPATWNNASLDLGASGQRWRNIWASNGTIQTSDERFKVKQGFTDIEECYEMIKDTDIYNYIMLNQNKEDLSKNRLGKLALNNSQEQVNVHMGIMAQDIQKYKCSKQILVEGDYKRADGSTDTMLSINPYGLTTAVMGALKVEIQKRELLEEKITKLESLVEQLTTQSVK